MASLSRTTRTLTLALAIAVALCGAATAQPRPVGEPPPAATAPPETVVQAREHYQKGLTHFDLKEYAEALVEFKNAYRLVQDPPLLFNIAQCHRRLGQNAEALDFYRNYLRRAPHSSNRSEVERRIREIERELPVEAKPATGLAADKMPPAKGRPQATTPPATAPPPAAARPPANPPTNPPSTTAPPPPPAATPPVTATAPPPAPIKPPPAAKPPTATKPPTPTPPPPAPATATTTATTAPGADLRTTADTTPAPAGKPIYKKWWFWAGIGVVAIATVTAVSAAKRGEIGDCSGIPTCITVEKGQ